MSNRETALNYLRLLTAGNVEEALGLVSDDARFGGPDGRSMTKAEMRGLFAFVGPQFAAPMDQHILSTIAEADHVSVEAKGRAPLKNGKIYENIYHFAFDFTDGKITGLREYCDTRATSVFDLP